METEEELFDLAIKTVQDNCDRILDLKQNFDCNFLNKENEEDYLRNLQVYYSDEKTRPYGTILLYNFYQYVKKDEMTAKRYIEELEYMKEHREVVKTLFSHYGRNLNQANNRNSFFSLTRNNSYLKERENFRYNYFNYVAESYNRHFKYSYSYIKEILDSQRNLNPNYYLDWLAADSNKIEVFEAVIEANKKGFFNAKVVDLGQTVYLLRDQIKNLKLYEGQKVKVNLRFYLYGIRGVIMEM